jgi:hypothetical protein
MGREIHLSGGEISLLKTIGLSGASTTGKQLLERIGEMEAAELLDALNGLITMGYILSNKVNISSMDDAGSAFFRVNASYARDLRDAINPGRRREDKTRRRRRRAE